MKNKEKKRFYRILARLYQDSRKYKWVSHPYTYNELCLVGHAFADEQWMPNNGTLSKYVKRLKKENETLK